ncbi:MAG: tRNA (N6-isopentenyl adenosine(37)-C2)-methylthiotransferase MiaB [Gemmataceae bacterium]|nr:tRNA (N6-isopentenyl adenosine(37)-C2)-methylthiotransferase MiaB [Gemmataceae bacterium]MCS7269778.1 tRNA (N6-isopentenyl adenosine(37)-C2)-methylthiotransferase MiaB [Gemmataceae bacterium]MDW8241953.1 tRNA (N6-isopentenyl adenosine(37)-C2)-methylthiotransferase MiaB [Thermogemmata sp.]
MTQQAKKVYIETVGCQMNVLDSEVVIGTLRRLGYTLADHPREADVILFNTCSVREHAEEKVYSALGRLRSLKRRRPQTIIGVLGCMAQKDQQHIVERAPHVDLIVGPGQLAEVPRLIEEARRTQQLQLAVSLGRAEAGRREVEASFVSFDPMRDPEMRPTPFQAYLRIQIGCDKFCTYCVVPSTRGPEQSRPPAHILAEARQLVDQGCKEITLLGQTVNSYRYVHGDGRITRLSDLLAALHDLPGLQRLKFVTNFPKDMSDDLLDAVRSLPKVVKYLHVPAQSGCDVILRRMKRNYTVAFYKEMLARCRERVPGVALSSDFIVGFCGETEESFARTVRLVEEGRFKNSYIFKYSERPGTQAAQRYVDDVPEQVKKRRNNDLLAVQTEISRADHRRYIGQRCSILVEGPSKRDQVRYQAGVTDGVIQLTGRTMTDHIVVCDGPPRLIGQIIDVDIVDASPFTLFGVVADARWPVDTVAATAPKAATAAERRRLPLPLVQG